MLRFLPHHARATCRKSAPPIQLPHLEAVDAGVVAVIDISGFTLLSTRLFREHGIDGAAKLHEAINRPFERIIRCVDARSGSIVKFAGDSAVVCWSDPVGDSTRREKLLLQSFLCCLELLQLFHSTLFKDAPTGTGGDVVGIHIGVGFGQVHHIYLGQRASEADKRKGGTLGRIEYLIGGRAVSEACAMLTSGHRGEVVLSREFTQALCDALPRFSGVQLSLLSDIHSLLRKQASTTISETDSTAMRIVELAAAERGWDRGEEAPSDDALDDIRALHLIEASIARYLADSGVSQGLERLTIATRPTAQWAMSSTNNSDDQYSDLRTVAVVFFGFPEIALGASSSSTSQSNTSNPIFAAQLATETVIASVEGNGGSLRQVNFDDKSFTALAVWGLRGSAHHRSEAQYAIQACIDFVDRIRRASVQHPGVEVGVVDIGVAMGTVYAGLIGNKLRMDGTVLGATVNLAARLMCTEVSAVYNELGSVRARVRCDEATYRACQDEFDFDTSAPKVWLKGFNDPVSVFQLLRTKEGQAKTLITSARQELLGRDEEIASIDQAVQRWRERNANQRLMLTGRSGLGKSALVQHVIQKVEGDEQTIACVCVAHEMRHRNSFAFFGSMLCTLIFRLMSRDVTPNHFASARKRASMASFGVSTNSNFDSQTLSQSDSDDPISLFLLELVCLTGTGGLGALGAVPGLRWRRHFPVTSGDVGLTLSSLFAQMLHLIEGLRYTIFFVCDDAQWIDQESLGVLQRLFHLCPSVFFVVAGRTREEWSSVEDFDAIESKCGASLQLNPVSASAIRQFIRRELRDFNVSEGLAEEIIKQSGGIPIALHVVLSLVKSDLGSQDAQQPITSSYLQRRATQKRKSVHELDINSAITVQLDSLSEEFRHAVSVASVIGQYFNINTLTEVIRALRAASGGESVTVIEIRHLFETEDRFGFVSHKSTIDDDFCFSHYLVHRGVFLSLLPQRRETIRRVLVDHLITCFNEENDDGVLLPTIIDHLTQLEGETHLKSEFLFKGFISAARARKSAEAFYYRAMLDETNKDYCSSLPLTMRLQDSGLRASLHFQSKEKDEFVATAAELLRLAGAQFTVPSKGAWRLLSSLRKHFHTLKLMQASSPAKAREICVRYLTETFPVAFPGKLPLGDKRLKAVHPCPNLDLLSLAPTTGEGLERLEIMFKAVEQLAYSSMNGRVQGLDFLYLTMALLFITHLGEKTESEKTLWLWRRQCALLGLGLLCYIAGMARANTCFEAATSFDPGPAVSLREMEQQGHYYLIVFVVNLVRKDTVELSDVLLLRNTVDLFKSAGAEFDVISKSSWVSIMTYYIVLGSFSPETEQDGVFKIESLLTSMKQCCVDTHFVLQIQCFAAFEAALRSEFSKAQSFLQSCAHDEINGTALGFDETNKTTVSYILVCVLSVPILLAEQGEPPPEAIDIIQRLGVEFVSHLKSLPSQLAQTNLMASMMIQAFLLGLGLSLFEQDLLDAHQRTQLTAIAVAISTAVRAYARRASHKIFFGACCVALSDATKFVFGKRLQRAEAGLCALLHRCDRRMPEHVRLMLEARVLRLRRICNGSEAVVAGVPGLLKRFEEFDNRCDPDRLRALFGL
ncbi:hypothetical protein DFJ73DRAFT_793723 [Zopfochytrium polystomum]|nr:hypothetical protein DFJ73DRAFT_793723 [Zopfochytrium polystomum]